MPILSLTKSIALLLNCQILVGNELGIHALPDVTTLC
jgi:hypothetical protein